MKICKYCKKPILDNCVWNPDSEGNGYHHACLCEMEFRLRDRQIYDKGRADVLDKIRAEIEHIGGDDEKAFCKNLNESYKQGLKDALKVINKYKAESESQESEEQNND